MASYSTTSDCRRVASAASPEEYEYYLRLVESYMRGLPATPIGSKQPPVEDKPKQLDKKLLLT